MKRVDVPVLIVGGGGAGLTASMLLSQLGVETLLVSSLPTTSILPKAHVLNQRAMEILHDVGVADEIYERGTPPENMQYSAWYAGLAGAHPCYGRQIARIESWGAGGLDLDWASASPCLQTNLPQIRLEPLLKARAEELAPGAVRFNHELTALEQDKEGVTSTVLDKGSGEEYQVRSHYVLGCDGGRTIGKLIGVEMEGPRGLMSVVSIHMTADLSKWAIDPEVLIRWIWLPRDGSQAVLVPMGPDNWGPHTEEWVFHLNYQTQDTRALDDAQVEEDMRQALGVGDHPVTIHKISRWALEGILAAKFQVGRTFLAGDAAHRHPPTGGLGLTSAIDDAHNICWKLALVLAGSASERLLETYEPERRPADGRNVRRSLENSFNHMRIREALGLREDTGEDANWEQLQRVWSHRPEDAEFRRNALRVIATQSMEFREHNVEYGYTYTSSAVVPDGSPEPIRQDEVHMYEPSTRPGNPLPHAWLDDLDGCRLPVMDLVEPGRFLLIAGEKGEPWCEAARIAGRSADVVLDTVRIGHTEGDYFDPRCDWLRRSEFSADGAILVRPDRFVAWRSMSAQANPEGLLTSALKRILGQ
jgi:2,4-dichlorophenol 6-monooxygenase